MKKEDFRITEDNETSRIELPRRDFLTKFGIGVGAAAALTLPAFGNSATADLSEIADSIVGNAFNKRYFRFAVIADTHIIDDFYKGPEGNPLDTETIFKTTERLKSARDLINSLNPPIEQVFVVGDFFHDYPSQDFDFFFKNKTRIDNAKELTDGFKMPVNIAFGNHDYDVPRVSREMSHSLFKEKLKTEPYYSVEHRGFKFVILNNFLGETWNAKGDKLNKGRGSLGEAQLNWFEAELKQQKPTFVFVHYPLFAMEATEVKDFGLQPLLKKYKDTVQMVVSGHWHRWFDFARTFGPQHYVIGATRFDEDAYMIIEVDTKTGKYKWLNPHLVDWATHYSQPFKG